MVPTDGKDLVTLGKREDFLKKRPGRHWRLGLFFRQIEDAAQAALETRASLSMSSVPIK